MSRREPLHAPNVHRTGSLNRGGRALRLASHEKPARFEVGLSGRKGAYNQTFIENRDVAAHSCVMNIGDSGAGSRLVRRVKAVRGSIHVRMRCMPCFDYARLDHKICAEAGTIIFRGGHLGLRLRASVPVDVSKGAALAEFDLAAGESASFLLQDPPSPDYTIAPTPRHVTPPFT